MVPNHHAACYDARTDFVDAALESLSVWSSAAGACVPPQGVARDRRGAFFTATIGCCLALPAGPSLHGSNHVSDDTEHTILTFKAATD
jgi:hypothetical protein